MTGRKYVQEDKQWVNNPQENAQYQRIARAWNAIHGVLASNPHAASTTKLQFDSVFFIICGELMVCEAFEDSFLASGIDINNTRSLNDFDGQSEDDLIEFAESLEEWLEQPTFISKGPKVNLLNSALLAEIDSDFHRSFAHEYLTTEAPESFLSRFEESNIEISVPDSLDFRA